ncbi:hypothetical protein CANCADRAFT_11762, partial [Tortispora caseinolytica NRRL Y-17796]
YYDLLEVESTASFEEIRRSYRKLALKLHPDRNFGNVEEATAQFSKIQAAYDILSDPDERAWYDSHKDQLEGGQATKTSTEDLLRFFNPSLYAKKDDAPDGMYTIANQIFDTIASEERKSGSGSFPRFGNSATPYDPNVKNFYSVWVGFNSSQSFASEDIYRTSDAPDRRIRRAMEKENKRLRDAARKEFSETVRALAKFIRKRDPRYKDNFLTNTQLREEARKRAEEQSKRDRAANEAKIREQLIHTEQWQVPESENYFEEDNGSEVSYVEEFECVACNKIFKTENQLVQHEKTKKHIKSVEKLRKEMLAEGLELGLDGPTEFSDREELDEVDDIDDIEEFDDEDEFDEVDDIDYVDEVDEEDFDNIEEVNDNDLEKDDVDDHDLDKDEFNEKHDTFVSMLGKESEDIDVQVENLQLSDTEKPQSSSSKKEKKKKAKKDKKANDNALKCNVCNDEFSSRNKLFDHIKATGHALAGPQSKKNSNK